MIIGENPATFTDTDWWSYWSDETGFEFNRWKGDYEAGRIARDKRPVSPTRLRLSLLRQMGWKVCETNAYSNERLDGHGGGVPNKLIVQALMAEMPDLRAIVAHGKVAQGFASTLDTRSLPVIRTKHFRLLSYDALRAILPTDLAK